jgi:hypothetical protein
MHECRLDAERGTPTVSETSVLSTFEEAGGVRVTVWRLHRGPYQSWPSSR